MNEHTATIAGNGSIGTDSTGMDTGFVEGDPDVQAERQVRFSVTLRDGATEEVVGADAYAQEQSMTTFFRTDGRRTVDCWAVRMASFRTEQILAVRRHEHAGAAAHRSRPVPA
jgi:hypothetical protein